MTTAAIRAHALGKRYDLGRTLRPHATLRESLVEGAGRLLESVRSRREAATSQEFWALRDVSFAIATGEAVGVIGGNGAGKSTLLKLLTRITAPTTGRGEIRGRVGSLLEVGTGFHPDLTGRENVFLNGAILGMQGAEIARKLDQIVAFAEVERFIDTPVKRYSSGMYLRLAFSVAAHLEPEVLLVDEVLAVGDAAFQQKCLGKMGEVTAEGRTVLLVSHNMDAIQRLCSRVLWIDRGALAADGDSREVTTSYLARSSAQMAPNSRIGLVDAQRRGSGEARFAAAVFRDPDHPAPGHPVSGGPLEFELELESTRPLDVPSLAVILYDVTGTKLVNADTVAIGRRIRLDEGRTTVRLAIDAVHLNPGRYVVGLWAGDVANQPYDFIRHAFEVELIPSAVAALGVTPRLDGLVPCRFVAERA